MGTRGALVFRIDGTDKVTYNHGGSYPDGLGAKVAKWLQGADLEDVASKARSLRMVTDSTPPTKAEQEAIGTAGLAEVCTDRPRPGQQWYDLLHHTQGDPQAILDTGIADDSHTFLADSLFCEWAYVVNLDEGKLEVYRGFQETRGRGRYAVAAERAEGGYWPVSLAAEIPFGPDVVEQVRACDQ